MKKYIKKFKKILIILIILGIIGCTYVFSVNAYMKNKVSDLIISSEIANTFEGTFGTYYEMQDGTWQYNGYAYKYRLVISGRMPNAVKDSTFVYLSNIEDISFQKAMMASGLSSNMEDYFSPEEAVFIGFE